MNPRNPCRGVLTLLFGATVIAALAAAPVLNITLHAQNLPVTVTINTTSEVHPISPLIYGINAYVSDIPFSLTKPGLANTDTGINITNRRLGGNTMTSYNWENGFSNSGYTSNYESNEYQTWVTGAGDAPYQPGIALSTFQGHSLSLHTYSLLQLPCAGYVAADGNGALTDPAPSPRWKALSFAKPGAPASYTASPDLNDNTVYVDEELYFMLNKYGAAGTATGVAGYELDNEPGDWHSFTNAQGVSGMHPYLHPDLTTCQEIIDKNVQLATMIRTMDPNAEIYGPAMAGYGEYFSLWNVYVDNALHYPSDWATFNVEPYTTNNTGDAYRYNHMTWINAYLAKMKAASDAAGKRLLDVLSLHYYSADADDALHRVQAPRSLWDPTYVENSYITQDGIGLTDGRAIQLIPKVQQAIADFYPGTKLAFTEWDFYGRHDITGTMAQADVLGILGKTNVYAANYFDPVDEYIAAAFRIYRNYDGNNSTFGGTSVASTSSDIANSSSYASIDASTGDLHLVYINKSFTQPEDVTLNITSPTIYRTLTVYSVGSVGTDIQKAATVSISGNTITYTVPKATVAHLVLSTTSSVSQNGPSASRLQFSRNPCYDGCSVSGFNDGPIAIDVFDNLGKRVQGTIHYSSSGPYTVALDLHSLPSGAYRVVLKGSGSLQSGSLIVMH